MDERIPGIEARQELPLCRKCRLNPLNPKTGTKRWCNPCTAAYQREWRRRNRDKSRDQIYEQSIRRRFGIDLEVYRSMLQAQNGVCAICGRAETARNKDGTLRRLQIDHDHKTGRIRELLCSGCNGGLAGFRDDPGRIKLAIAYIKEWSG